MILGGREKGFALQQGISLTPNLRMSVLSYSGLRRMSVLRCLRPDSTVSAASDFVASHLGPDFARARPPLDLQVILQ